MSTYTVTIHKDGQDYEVDVEKPDEPIGSGGQSTFDKNLAENKQLDNEAVNAASQFGKNDFLSAAKQSIPAIPSGPALLPMQFAANLAMQHPGASNTLAHYPTRKAAMGLKTMTDAIPDPQTPSVAANFMLGLPKSALELGSGLSAASISPEAAAMEAGLPAIKAAGSPIVKKMLKKGGKQILGVSEKATEQALQNPAVTAGDEYVTPEKIETITARLKDAVDSMHKKISDLYENFLSKAGKTGQKVESKPVLEALDKAAEKIGAEKQITKSSDFLTSEERLVGKKGSQQKVDNASIGKLNRVVKKIKEDVAMNLDEKFDAPTTLRQRQLVDRHIDWQNPGNVLNSALKDVRKVIDKGAKLFPDLKEIDAETVQSKKAFGTLKRRFGIKPGTGASSDINDANIQKTAQTIKGLFRKDSDVLEKAIHAATKKIGAESVMASLRDLAAAKEFEAGPLLTTFTNLNAKSAGKRLFGMIIRNAKAASDSSSSQVLKKVASTYAGYKANKK